MSDGPADFRIWPQSAIWWFFPGFGALTLSWEITLQLWSHLGNRDDASLYAYWSNQRTGLMQPGYFDGLQFLSRYQSEF